MDACLEWLNLVAPIPNGKAMLSTVKKRQLLNYFTEGCEINGTTDIVIIPTRYQHAIRLGIQVAFELKTGHIQDADCHQAVLELLTASTFSHFPVVVILTNLNKHWQFFWLSKSGISQTPTLEPRHALTLLQHILNETGAYPLNERYTFKQYLEKHGTTVTPRNSQPYTKDQFLSEVNEKVHPYDLIPKPDVGNLEDFFPNMTEAEIRGYKEKMTMRHLTSCRDLGETGTKV